MNLVFYLSAAVAIVATVMVITRPNAMHALLYLVLSFLSMALMFFTLGAPFVAILEVIVYAGAIMVLFIFAIMLLNIGSESTNLERTWLRASNWVAPAILALLLLGEVIYILLAPGTHGPGSQVVDPRQVGAALYTTYLIGVELASILLLASLVGAYHLGQFRKVEDKLREARTVAGKMAATEEGAPELSPDEALQVEKER